MTFNETKKTFSLQGKVCKCGVAWPQFSQKKRKNEKNYLFYGETLHVFTCIATSCKYCHTSIANFQGYISAQGCQKVCNSGGAQCVELELRWQFCVHGSTSPEIYL